MDNKTFEHNYVERDVSWMYFNSRILQEAERQTVPLLERLNYLGIYSNNLDEFFRVRVASLNRILEYAESKEKKLIAETSATLKKVNKLNARFVQRFEKATTEIMQELEKEGIALLKEDDLNDDQQAFVYDFFHNKLSGYINPLWLSNQKYLNADDDGIFLAVKMLKWHEKKKNPEKFYAAIDIPVKEFGRFVRIPDSDGKCCLMWLDDVIRACLPYVFVGMGLSNYQAFSIKFTKDAEMEIDTDLRNGLMQKISKGVKSRKKGAATRVIYDENAPKDLLKVVMAKLAIDKLDTIIAGGRYQNHKDFMKFPDCGRSDLKFPDWKPIRKQELSDVSVIQAVRERDRFVHVPYHSFDSFIQLLREAAISKDVKSIKITLYRLAKDSKVVKALMCAARNGKKVTAVIELLARFDEASNIDWSKRMQDAGVNVVFGVEGLKIHSKIVHIESRSGSVACISTGNFHEGNAKCYTDYVLMTANRQVVNDVERVFRFIERPYAPVAFKELLVSPNEMRTKVMKLIDTEIKNQMAGKPAGIMGKINHITDVKIARKLYEAAECGVPVKMLVRGNCSIREGVDSCCGRLELRGIIDRYLEHSRILIFENGGDEKCYIGSADWMTRNLDNRIEVMTPVYDPVIRADLRKVVEFGLADSSQGRIVDGEGKNELPECEGERFRSQEALRQYYINQENKEQL